jgi:hypothetical protein
MKITSSLQGQHIQSLLVLGVPSRLAVLRRIQEQQAAFQAQAPFFLQLAAVVADIQGTLLGMMAVAAAVEAVPQVAALSIPTTLLGVLGPLHKSRGLQEGGQSLVMVEVAVEPWLQVEQ